MAHFKITKTVTISILSSFLVVSSSFAETEFKFPEIRLNNRETPVKKVTPATKKNSTKNKETNTVKETPKEEVLVLLPSMITCDFLPPLQKEDFFDGALLLKKQNHILELLFNSEHSLLCFYLL